MRVDGDNLLDRAGAAGEGTGAALILGDALDRVDHILGVERGAVGEGHALPQLELPREIVDRTPGVGQQRLEPEIAIDPHQALVNLGEQRGVVYVVVIVGIERAVGEPGADHQIRRDGGAGRSRGEKQAGSEGAKGHDGLRSKEIRLRTEIIRRRREA